MPLDATDRRILDAIQSDFPLERRPYDVLAERLGLEAGEVLARVRRLSEAGYVRRIGPVIDPQRLGRVGTLAAAAVPEERLDTVADAVSQFDAVTHNYLRVARHGTCPFNLWFTVGAGSDETLAETVRRIEAAIRLPVTVLGSRRKFKIGVRFALAEDNGDG